MAGDYKRFLERTAKIQAGLMVCVYCLSYAPALLSLEIKGYEGQNARLLFFFVLVVQMSDALQYAWGKLLGEHVIAPAISASRTWEGFLAARPVPRCSAPPCGGPRRSSPGKRPACRW